MEELEFALQEYVLTANNPKYNGDYSVINSKFPELADIDPFVLQEYVLTANDPKYGGDWSVINSKFPELKTQKEETETDSPFKLPKITKEETKLVEELGIRELQTKLSGLGFTFKESSLIGGADWMPGSDYITITSPPNADGETVSKKFSFEAPDLRYKDGKKGIGYEGSAQGVADRINTFISEHAKKSENYTDEGVDPALYTNSWNYANKIAKQYDYKNLSSGEQWDLSNKIVDDLNNSSGYDLVKDDVFNNMQSFLNETAIDLKKKHNVNTEAGINAFYEDLENIAEKEFTKRILANSDYKKIKNTHEKAVQSFFSQEIPLKMREEGEIEVMPEWVNKNPVMQNLVKGAWGTSMVKIPGKSYEFTALNESKKLSDVYTQIEELEDMDPNEEIFYNKGFSANPEVNIPTKKYKPSELIPLLERNKKIYEEKVTQAIVSSEEYQNRLSKIVTPKLFDEDGFNVTGEEFWRMIGDQGVQMIGAVLSMGGTTLLQEGGGAYTEITTAKAAMKMFPEMDKDEAIAEFQNLSMDDKTSAILDLIEKGEANLDTAFGIGVTNAGLDMISNVIVIGKATKFLPKSLTRDFINQRYKEFLKGGWKSFGKDVTIGSFAEFLTETSQEGVNIFGVGTATGEGISDMVNKENLMRLLEAGGQAIMTTGPIVGGGQIVSTTGKEMISRIAAAKDPNHQRNLVNAEKKRINELFEQGRYTQKERDQLFTDLEAVEQSTNFGIIETKKGRENVIKHKTQILKNQQEQKEIEAKPRDILTGELSNVTDQIRLEEIKKENQNLEKKIIQEVFDSHYEGNGKTTAQYINDAKEGIFKDYSILQFDTHKQTVKAIEAAIKKGEIKLNATEQKMFEEFKLGKDNAIKIGKTAYLSNDIIRRNNKKGDWSSTNAVHHEGLHMILDAVDPKELKSWMNKTTDLMSGSEDPFIQKVFPNFMQRYGQYLNDKNYWTGKKAGEGEMKPELVQEYFTSLSDAMQAVKLSNINVENGSVFNEMGRLLQGIFSKNTKGSIDFSGLNAENMLEFIKKYNDFNGRGPKYQDIQLRGGTDIREPGVVESKGMGQKTPEELVKIIQRGQNPQRVKEANEALAPQFELLALSEKALNYDTRKGDIAREDVVAEAMTYLPGIIKRYNKKDGAFSTFVISNMKPKRQVIYEKVKPLTYGETISTDTKEAREIADVPTETTSKGTDMRRKKTNVLKIGKVERKADTIKKIVKVKKGDTFKEVSDNNTGKVAEEIFDVPANKITDPKKNLTYAKKIKDGIPEPSEAGNIQSFYGDKQTVEQLVKILPPENVTSSDADINEIGENIDVDREVLGRGLGLTNRMLNYFYNKTNKRSKGLTSQPFIWELKSEFKNPTSEIIDQLQEDLGITPRGELNKYNRNIGQLLKGMAKFQAQQTALSTAQRILTEQKASKKQIASVTAAQSSKVAFSKGMQDVDNIISVRDTLELETKAIDGVLKFFGIKQTFNLKTEAGRKKFLEAMPTKLLPIMPKEFWMSETGIDVFTGSNKNYGLSMSKAKEAREYNKFRDEVRELISKHPENEFGKPIKNANWNIDKIYTTIFGNKNTFKTKTKDVKRIEKWNEDIGLIHEEMWNRFNKAMRADKSGETARIIGTYLKLTANDKKSWHRLGAQYAGSSIKLTKRKKGDPNIEFEHAMPATAAYLYLMHSSLNSSVDFNTAYDLVIENYKLIVLDKAMDDKLTTARTENGYSLQKRMPDNWSVVDGKWWQRYFNEIVVGVDGVGIDPNSIVGLDGKTFAEKYNIKNPIVKPSVRKTKKLNKAVVKARTKVTQSKGITVLDFDDTLATTKSLVRYTTPDGKKGTLNAEEFANTYQDLLDQGYVFDFTEFNKVVKGKVAPLFQKALKLQDKFGPENMFVLTARPPQATKAIRDFLKANGLNIPLKNITGLANSTSEAKALWIADKVGEGYNDFYFADDALQNVQAVKNMLNQFDVKSKVQQAKVSFSKGMNTDFNNILEDITGIESKKRFSAVKARKRGAGKGKFRFFIPPSHEDFVGLLYNFIGKGRKGDAHRDFFEKALVRPLNRAFRELNTARQSIANDYKNLNKQMPGVKKRLNKKTPDGDFTYQDAIRVYLWNKHGYDIPGLTPTDQKQLSDLVKNDSELQSYAETLNVISKQDKYVDPTSGWEVTDIRVDLDNATGRVGRAQFFAEFQENADIIFSPENLNKIEAIYGPDMVSAIKDMLYRIKTGRNRPSGQNKTVNGFMNWFNNSVAATMFVNIRSVVLQQMSLVNFINYSDNNILAAAKAFANQKQYWTDWAFLFNSDFMKQRRGGIKTDVNGAELVESLKGAKNGPVALLGKLLQMGFKPTQIGDNIAIATGGATYYRNRINTYLKQGLSQKEAEAKAFVDFQVLAEATQQSARPDMVSQQQASPLGKIILAFQNVTSQFNRLGKKAFLDIKNRRISPEYKNAKNPQLQSDMSNLSRIAYYFAMQNLIFYSLQTALFAAMFDDDEDDKQLLRKKERVINGSIDSVLRGTGVWGAVVATLKNMAIKRFENEGKDWNADVYSVLAEALQVSPPLGSRVRKLVKAEKELIWDKKVIDEMKTLDIENPLWSATTNYIEGTTNAPLNRIYNLTLQVKDGLDSQFKALQRVLRVGGWGRWDLGIEPESKKVKESIKKKKKKKKNKYLEIPLK